MTGQSQTYSIPTVEEFHWLVRGIPSTKALGVVWQAAEAARSGSQTFGLGQTRVENPPTEMLQERFGRSANLPCQFSGLPVAIPDACNGHDPGNFITLYVLQYPSGFVRAHHRPTDGCPLQTLSTRLR